MRTFAKEPNANRPTASTRTGLLNSLASGESQKIDLISRLQRSIGNQALQRSLLNKPDALATVEEALRSPGQPLDGATRLVMEPRIQHDLSGVRLHTGSQASESAKAVGALAYTVGSDIVFGASQYDPHSPSGAGLLAHELTHVAQARGGPSPLRRKPDPNKLNLRVPDPNMVGVFKPSVDYSWQNVNLRASLFPYRESAFREFLLKEKGMDLREEARTGFPAELLSEIGEKILRERRALDFELRVHKHQRLKAEADLRATQKEEKQHLAEREVRDQTRQKRELEAQQKSLTNKAHVQEARITELERKDAIGTSEQTELEKRREMLAEIQAELTNTTQSLQEVSSTLEGGMAPFRSTEAKLKGEIEEHKKQEKTLKPRFDRVSGGVDAKTKKANPGTAANWQLDEYEQKIKNMNHDQLLGLILDRFAADTDFKRYPKQDRYLVIHFSGMRYASANKTYGPPKELVATLKEQEIREMFEDPTRKEEVEKVAEETGAAVESELKSGKIGSSRKAELRDVKKGILDTPAAIRAGLFKKNPQFERLETLTAERAKALEQKDDAKATELSEQIEQLEKEIGEPKLKKLRAALQAADLSRLKVLRDFRVKEAKEQIGKLNDLQVLGMLQAMQDQFPAWVWDLVVRRTQLRVNFTDSKKWEDPNPKDPSQMYKLKRALMDPRWKKIMDGWPREGTSWNPKFAKTYEIVAETVVCNQLSEQAQHLRGQNISQGIRGAVLWYRNQESEAKTKGLTGAGQPFFIRPTKKEDFVRGTGIFWAHFEKKVKPAAENMALPLSGIDFLTEGKQAMSDKLKEGEWVYHIDPTTKEITRTKGEADKEETQWFAWQHEATVIKLDDLGNVITFETSGGSRWTTRSLKSLTDPMSVDWIRNLHDDTNVFVGFAPEGQVLPELDKSLENILPGRNAY